MVQCDAQEALGDDFGGPSGAVDLEVANGAHGVLRNGAGSRV